MLVAVVATGYSCTSSGIGDSVVTRDLLERQLTTPSSSTRRRRRGVLT